MFPPYSTGLQKDPFNLCFRVVAEIDPESQFKTGCFQIVIDLNTVFSVQLQFLYGFDFIFRVFCVFRGLIENCKLTTEYSKKRYKKIPRGKNPGGSGKQILATGG